MLNILNYSIRDEMLYGTISSRSMSMFAFSGGGRGSTAGMEQTDIRHWNSQKKAPATFSRQDRGGPLPAGLYLVNYHGVHEHLGRCAALTQTISSLVYADPFSDIGIAVTERDGFYIHGRGPKGSDGCIVPSKSGDLTKILDAIKAATDPIVLIVKNEGADADRFNSFQYA